MLTTCRSPQVATWHPYAASPETATVAQLAADVKRIRAALSQAEVRNRELGAQLAEALSQLAAPRTANGIETASGIGSASGIDADGLKKAVAGAQAGQVAAEERATRLEDELRLAKQGAQNDPTQVRQS